MHNEDKSNHKINWLLVAAVILFFISVVVIVLAALGYNGFLKTELSPGEAVWTLKWWDSSSTTTPTPSATSPVSSEPFSMLETTSSPLTMGVSASPSPIIASPSTVSFQLKGYDTATGMYDYVYFGRYPQVGDNDPILWRVLTVQNGLALLLSEKVLDAHRYDTSSKNWEGSDLKTWLNNDFISTAFSPKERASIVDSTERGKVFPLLEDDLKKSEYGFTSNETDLTRSAIPTEHALGKAVDSRNGKSIYYTRTPGDGDNIVAVTSKGILSLAGIERDDLGIRPAIWIKTSEFSISKGEGSHQQPFILL